MANAAIRGIQLERLGVETTGEVDLRGFLGPSDTVIPGIDCPRHVVRVRDDGTPEPFQEIHDVVQ